MLMDLVIGIGGDVRCVYGEAIDLAQLGRLAIARASHVEPDEEGRWLADLAPVGGPVLGPFNLRSEALAAEADWLREHNIQSAEKAELAPLQSVNRIAEERESVR